MSVKGPCLKAIAGADDARGEAGVQQCGRVRVGGGGGRRPGVPALLQPADHPPRRQAGQCAAAQCAPQKSTVSLIRASCSSCSTARAVGCGTQLWTWLFTMESAVPSPCGACTHPSASPLVMHATVAVLRNYAACMAPCMPNAEPVTDAHAHVLAAGRGKKGRPEAAICGERSPCALLSVCSGLCPRLCGPVKALPGSRHLHRLPGLRVWGHCFCCC